MQDVLNSHFAMNWSKESPARRLRQGGRGGLPHLLVYLITDQRLHHVRFNQLTALASTELLARHELTSANCHNLGLGILPLVCLWICLCLSPPGNQAAVREVLLFPPTAPHSVPYPDDHLTYQSHIISFKLAKSAILGRFCPKKRSF